MSRSGVNIHVAKHKDYIDGYYKNRTSKSVHNFYITGDIEEPTFYTDWFEIIREAEEGDVIYFHINSRGGDPFTAIQLMKAIEESSAVVICSAEGMCISAATFVFLKGDIFEIANHSMFMFHNYSTDTFGKGGEIYDNAIHERQWSTDLFKETYKGFLTESEIEKLLDGKDFWMDKKEVIRRLKKNNKEIIDNEDFEEILESTPKKAKRKKVIKKGK